LSFNGALTLPAPAALTASFTSRASVSQQRDYLGTTLKRTDYSHLLTRNSSLLVRYQNRILAAQGRTVAAHSINQTAQLARLDAVMSKIVDATVDAVITVDANGRIETANGGAEMTFGLSPNQLTKLNIESILPDFNNLITPGHERFIVGSGHYEGQAIRASGAAFPIDIVISETRVGTDILHVLVARDITEIRHQQARLEHQALHDALTGLPNRVLLGNRVDHALQASVRNGNLVGLLLLDLDRFKEVNDTLGHHVGDALLIELSERLQHVVRNSDTVARLGGDEFAVLLPHVDSVAQAIDLAKRILAVFQQQFVLKDGIALDVGCSIGIAISPTHADEHGKLMQCADVAMYRAKGGAQKIIIYDQSKDTNSVRQLTLSSELRQAIRELTLAMEYQPQLCIRSQLIKSVEGLARWRHPTLGYVPPDEFVTHAEQGGLITELTRWTFETALTQLNTWSASGVGLSLSVNLSAKVLTDPTLPDVLSVMLRDSRVSPEKLMLEITESALMNDPDLALQVIKALADLGVRLSIDDFGTGFSSLAYLQKLPLDEIKIDKSFVFGMLESHNDGVIVRSTIDLAHNLGFTVVAEGVENIDHIEALARLDCDLAQGFCISPALKIDLLDQWLSSAKWDVLRQAA
jgi:diguanylate cyclase (GGDEF)-like protein/PAS domain S-box-containing protein